MLQKYVPRGERPRLAALVLHLVVHAHEVVLVGHGAAGEVERALGAELR